MNNAPVVGLETLYKELDNYPSSRSLVEVFLMVSEHAPHKEAWLHSFFQDNLTKVALSGRCSLIGQVGLIQLSNNAFGASIRKEILHSVVRYQRAAMWKARQRVPYVTHLSGQCQNQNAS